MSGWVDAALEYRLNKHWDSMCSGDFPSASSWMRLRRSPPGCAPHRRWKTEQVDRPHHDHRELGGAPVVQRPAPRGRLTR